MVLYVKNIQGEHIGTVTGTAGASFEIRDASKEFDVLMKELLTSGIEQRTGMYDFTKKIFITGYKKITRENRYFMLVLKETLIRKGYFVTESHPEVDEAIVRALADFPDCADKKDIIKRLPEMSYLEKTFVLDMVNKFETV